VREDDPSDWLCAFARDGEFPAERWAQNMARTYNERLERRDAGPRDPLERAPATRRDRAR
jgi:hypothetical protein